MASLSMADSRRMYSWWWNSHISPKNSKWLQENLTDVDIKVKAMIKLIEEDGDSFAKKAEMYYKKRPELMKLVEELYRAYRALAERYDHATRALRQAHKTITEAFPNQCDDSAPNSPYEPDSQTPDSRTFDPVDLIDGSTGTVRKVLNFSDSEDGGHINGPRDRNLCQLENESKSQKLKETLEILEAKMEESLELYKRAREKIQENENITEKLKDERDSAYDQYKKSMEMKSDVEKKLVELEKEIEILRLEIIKLNKEKEQQTLLHQQYLEETEKLKTDIGNAVSLFKKAEKERLTLEKSNEDLEMKLGSQNQEIAEKQKELGRLWACIHEERLRFVEAETAFQKVQQLQSQSQSQEELQNRARILEKIENRNKKLKNEINKQIEENKNLEQEVDQRNALQQEIYCLKEELNGLKSAHGSILEELSNAGLNPENLGSSVKELQDENFKLKENFLTEKSGLHAKLEVMGQLLEKNLIVVNSISDLGTEKSNLAVENGNLSGQLRVTTDNLTQIMKKNTLLENSLFDTHVKLEVLKQKSIGFQDSCQVLADEKYALVTEKGTLLSQIEITETTLKNLEGKYSLLEKERESTLCKVEELNLSLALQNQEHVILRNQIQLLQEQGHKKDKEFENGLEKSFDSEIEIFVLLKCVQDLEEKNVSLFNDFKKLLEAYDLLENLVNVLKQEKNENEIKIKSLFDQNNNLKIGFEGNKCALIEYEDKNMKLVVEISILAAFIKQLKIEMAVIEAEKCGLENGAHELSEVNEGLRLKVSEGDFNEQMLKFQLENLNSEFLNVQEGYRALQMENSTVLEEKKYLLEDNLLKNKKLEDARTENLDLERDLVKSELELKTVISVSDWLNCELLNGNNLLQLKENEHKEAVQQLMDLESDKKELMEIITDLERENNEGKTVNEEQKKQIVKLLEDNYLLEVKLHELTENQEKTEETGRLLEEQGMLVFGDLVASNICQIVLEETIREENAFLDLNNELIKEKSSILESENGEIKARLASYGSILGSLRDSIVSLENHTCVRTKVPQSDHEDAKADESVTMNQGPLTELQDLQSKVKVIEIGVLEMQQERLETDAKVESLTKQIEELILITQKKSRSEISESDPKDIMLDQASECSSYAVSKRGLTEGEIWETADDSKHHPTASDVSFIVDKLEASRRFKEHREENGNKRKVLERLNSDVLKLTNLQITIEDLKRKVEITSRSRRGKSMIECETLKGQLMESESTIQKLYELNGKLVKHIDGIGKSMESEFGESEITRRKKVSEQAIRVSEKIGRLQLEIQKIQFVLLKLDVENEGEIGFSGSNSKRVLLKDYLYGGRTKTAVSSRRKKGHFCACVEPSTKGH